MRKQKGARGNGLRNLILAGSLSLFGCSSLYQVKDAEAATENESLDTLSNKVHEFFDGKVKIKTGDNSLGVGLVYNTNKDAEERLTLRSRISTNFSLEVGPVEIGHDGYNEVDNGTVETYFGINNFFIGKSKKSPKFVVRTIKNLEDDEIMPGLRVSSIPFVDNLDFTLGGDSSNIRGSYILELGKGVSLRVLGDLELPYQREKGEPSLYVELEMLKRFGERNGIFLRVELNSLSEISHIRGKDNGTRFLIGYDWKF